LNNNVVLFRRGQTIGAHFDRQGALIMVFFQARPQPGMPAHRATDNAVGEVSVRDGSVEGHRVSFQRMT
jgi:hypothetical protein